MHQNNKVKSIMIYACDANNYSQQIKKINTILAHCDKPIVGGIFPQIIYNKKSYENGFILIGLPNIITTFIAHDLSNNQINYETILDTLIPEEVEFKTMFISIDGLSARIGNFVESLYAVFGDSINYIGGGAGSLSFEQKPCVLNNQGLFQDAAIIALFDQIMPTQVGHGWQAFDENHQITSVDKNIVKEIDYKNALETYESIISSQISSSINTDNFFTIAQSFPLGIKRMEGGYIVRDPIAINDQGHLICVGELSQGDYIDILTADKKTLIASAADTGKKLKQQVTKADGILLIDCISRALFLNEDFEQELIAIQDNFSNTPMFGALVLGEISNSGSGYLEFYNKTSVIAAL
ncbi:hypothetical protein CRYPA_1776 [uncultured Candidatus Thioglobus sp.]|nr:hypothetical protein CRYPA_1776 [uncultured Candidatus Thioglobus sp.]